MLEYLYYDIFTRLTQTHLRFCSSRREKSEPVRLFNVARSTIRWLVAQDPFAIKKPGPKKIRVIDDQPLRKHVADFPDFTQKERAEHFGVSEYCIGYGLRKLGITRKKHSGINSTVMRNKTGRRNQKV